MSNTVWRQLFNDFLSYSRSDRNAVIIIGVTIFLVVIANSIVLRISPKADNGFAEIENIVEEWENAQASGKEADELILFDFDPNTISTQQLDSLSVPDFVKRNLQSYRTAGGKFKSVADVRKIYGMTDSVFAMLENYIQIKEAKKVILAAKTKSPNKTTGFFDPNKVPGSELKKFGFNDYQINNLVNYRSKGGKFSESSDLLKIYGIDSVFYLQIEQHIQIESFQNEEQTIPEQVAILELNGADSADLVGLHGIGPVYATRIIKYRDLLGGFYSKEQLKEVYNFPEETYEQIKDLVDVDTLLVTKLRINFLEYSELLRHPYFSKNQVEALLYHRNQQGALKNIAEVKAIKGFDSEMFNKLSPYITCR